MMTIFAPFTIDLSCDCKASLLGHEKEENTKRNNLPITYWRIYLYNKRISYVSSKKMAEGTEL